MGKEDRIVIRTEIERINKEIVKLEKEKETIQDKCKHPEVNVSPEGNIGNEDPEDTTFFCRCLDCLKYYYQ
jgi:hypothetical protein